MYTVMGLGFIIGWIGIKFITIFMTKKDKNEINTIYKGFKPDRKDWE